MPIISFSTGLQLPPSHPPPQDSAPAPAVRRRSRPFPRRNPSRIEFTGISSKSFPRRIQLPAFRIPNTPCGPSPFLTLPASRSDGDFGSGASGPGSDSRGPVSDVPLPLPSSSGGSGSSGSGSGSGTDAGEGDGGGERGLKLPSAAARRGLAALRAPFGAGSDKDKGKHFSGKHFSVCFRKQTRMPRLAPAATRTRAGATAAPTWSGR